MAFISHIFRTFVAALALLAALTKVQIVMPATPATEEKPMILVLRPTRCFSITTAELKRVGSLGRYMMVEGAVFVDATMPQAMHRLLTLCDELQPGRLYAQFANKKVFRHEKDLWASDDANVRRHLRRMADKRLDEAVALANDLSIPILFAPTDSTALHLDEQLRLQHDTVVPVMDFRRHGEGTTYRLLLRIGDEQVTNLSAHHLVVLTHRPGLFALDSRLYRLAEDYSAQLLLPFVSKDVVEIPKKLENDYFRRFILRHVSRVEVRAEGFHIDDVNPSLQACLSVEKNIEGRPLLRLHFVYGSQDYGVDSTTAGRVTLEETADGGFRFIRQLRDRRSEQQLCQALRGLAPALDSRGLLFFDSQATLIDFLRSHGQALRRAGLNVVQPSDHAYYIGPLSVEQSDTWQGDWLQTKVTVVLDEGRLRVPFSDLRTAILNGEQEYLLPTGERLLIPPEWLERYSRLLLVGTPSGDGFRRHRSQVAAMEASDTDGHNPEKQPPMHSSGGSAHVDLPTRLKARLRPYQTAGFEWLWHNYEAQTGCCLSDEMGLGKTVQTIALLLKYKETTVRADGFSPSVNATPVMGSLFTDEEMRGEAAPVATAAPPLRTSLVVAPTSVVHNWRNELERFAPSLLVLDYTGYAAKRSMKRQALMKWDVVVTTYRTLLNDIDHFANQQFGIVVFDESQAFKTSTSLIHAAVTTLKAEFRLALSGTPVENNLGELWSLMSVLNPALLGDRRYFEQAFVVPIAQQMEQERSQVLRQLISPYFLKRTKAEVLGDLPERQDEVVVCPMTDEQASLYAAELSRARNEWLDPDVSETQRHFTMLAALQRLRHIANGQGKMDTVFDRLESLRGTSHKVLLFSEYVSLLERVGQEMGRRGWLYDMLTGHTRQREQVVSHFQQTLECQFFLISLKAGGVGLNLTAADYVFMLDPWWNIAAEEQAIARAHRIGQRHSVFVYRFVSADTLEEQILTLQERKQTLIDSVMPFIL